MWAQPPYDFTLEGPWGETMAQGVYSALEVYAGERKQLWEEKKKPGKRDFNFIQQYSLRHNYMPIPVESRENITLNQTDMVLMMPDVTVININMEGAQGLCKRKGRAAG